MGVRAIIFKEEMSRYIFNMSAGAFARIVALGAAAGLVTWLLAYAINHYMMVPFFCNNDSATSVCLNSTTISANIAAVLVGVMIVPILAMISMKRALLVVVAAVIALWNVRRGLAARGMHRSFGLSLPMWRYLRLWRGLIGCAAIWRLSSFWVSLSFWLVWR